MSVEDGFQALEERSNEFYRHNYRKLQTITLFLVLIGIGLSVVLAYWVLKPQQPKYYTTTSTGEVTPLHSLSQPMVTNNFILQWADMVARRAYSLNFSEAQQNLSALKPYFTDDGWDALNNAYQSSGYLSTIQNNKLISSAVVDGPTVILRELLVEGVYTWQVQVPLLITYESASSTSTQFVAVTMMIQRSSTLAAPNGIQVDRLLQGALDENALLSGQSNKNGGGQ